MRIRTVSLIATIACGVCSAAHVWEKQELTFTSARAWPNPYTSVTVWVDVDGPSLHQRVYGFWDGGRTFRVRLLATAPGVWRWRSGSEPADPGLAGKSGAFEAVPWTEAEKAANPLRRGFLRATANHHAVELADGTPFFILGDTEYSIATNSFRWYDDDAERPLGPQAGFKDYVRYRHREGYNAVAIIAAFPAWATDGYPAHIYLNDADHTCVRSAWTAYGTTSAKNMVNEGGRPFLFPGKVPGYETVYPDIDRLNPAYFQYLDRKVDYLNAQGIIPFIEVARRDVSMCWKKFYGWPDSYARYIQYVWARYQANNCVFSPIHFDIDEETVPASDYNEAIALVMRRFGPPPYGTLLTANANPSTLVNFGEPSWVTLHQMGNKREHDWYWYLTEIFQAPVPRPALNGEPYYAGYKDVFGLGHGGYQYGAEGGSELDDQYVRSGMYGSFLSGGLAGHIYGAEGIWGADIEPTAPVKMWDAFQWRSGAQMKYLRDFAFSIGRRFQDLVPDANLVSPSKTHTVLGYEGWAYCARTPDKTAFLAYFEKGCPHSRIRAARLSSRYRAQWFDPRNGTWVDAGILEANNIGIITLPPFPSDADWGLRLEYAGPGERKPE
ncbi:MAG TPA: DUF4038 domain-containing protein [Bryobacteraceae bacterium]|nr:DUF4038 domain-containing protein [Bryobacteraceae bacterium]